MKLRNIFGGGKLPPRADSTVVMESGVSPPPNPFQTHDRDRPKTLQQPQSNEPPAQEPTKPQETPGQT